VAATSASWAPGRTSRVERSKRITRAAVAALVQRAETAVRERDERSAVIIEGLTVQLAAERAEVQRLREIISQVATGLTDWHNDWGLGTNQPARLSKDSMESRASRFALRLREAIDPPTGDTTHE